MKRILRRLPSPRFCGPTDRALSLVDQLTGAKVVESTLEKVPSSSSTDTASNANTVGGDWSGASPPRSRRTGPRRPC